MFTRDLQRRNAPVGVESGSDETVEEPDVGKTDGLNGDDMEWEGIASGEEEDGPEIIAPHRTSENVNKPPTRDELRSIKEASDLFKSSAFKFAVRISCESHVCRLV